MNTSALEFDTRFCLECGKELKGRLGKKYCDAACKSAYHNRHKNFGEITIQETNRIIRHNRSILKTLCPQGKATVRKQVLDQMGFDYRYFSSIFKSEMGVYYLSYDYGFSPIRDSRNIEKAVIVQKQSYMDTLSLDIWKK